jgi:hypothetical protein
MPDQTEIAEQLELLETHRRTLAHYLHQEAIIGSPYAPPSVNHGITTARSEIQRLKAALRRWGVEIEDHPNDNDVVHTEADAQPHLNPRLNAPEQDSGVNISAGYVKVGGDIVGRDKITTFTRDPGFGDQTELVNQFAYIKQKIDQRVIDPDIDKTELRELIERIEQEVVKGEAANPSKVERWLQVLAATADDIFQPTVATLLHPFTGVAQTIQSVAKKMSRLA